MRYNMCMPFSIRTKSFCPISNYLKTICTNTALYKEVRRSKMTQKTLESTNAFYPRTRVFGAKHLKLDYHEKK